MSFLRSLTNNKSPLVSKILLRISSDLNNTVVWMVSIPSQIFKSLSLFPKPSVTVLSEQVISLYSFESFSCQLMVFHLSLRDNRCLQVSRNLPRILADLCNALVWMSSTSPLISKSSHPFNNLLGILPSAPITFGITVTGRNCVSFYRSGLISIWSIAYWTLFTGPGSLEDMGILY